MQLSPLVYVIDDNKDMLESVRWLIESDGLTVKTFSDAQSFLQNYQPTHPCCLLLDIRMPGMTGLELQEELNTHNIELPIIFITGHGDVTMAVRAMKKGAVNFLTKPFREQALLESIHEALKLDEKHEHDSKKLVTIQARINNLTPREHDVLELVVMGKLNKVIAADLGIGMKTVEIHRSRIMQKMHAGSVAELVKMVMLAEQHSPTQA